jgi:hypothetical protein
LSFIACLRLQPEDGVSVFCAEGCVCAKASAGIKTKLAIRSPAVYLRRFLIVIAMLDPSG